MGNGYLGLRTALVLSHKLQSKEPRTIREVSNAEGLQECAFPFGFPEGKPKRVPTPKRTPSAIRMQNESRD